MLWTDNGGWGDSSILSQVPPSISHLFGLVLNPMRGRMEECRLVAVADTRDELVQFVRGEQVEPYKDDTWHKTFRKGGPLDWFNPPHSLDGPADSWGQGIIELRKNGWQRVG